MTLKKITFIIIFLLFNLNVYSIENKILIKVDNEIITTVDIFKETQYLFAINKIIKKLPKNKVFEIAKNLLIKKTIKEKEISKYMNNINLDEKYTNQLIKSNALKLGFNSTYEFKNHLKSFDIKIEDVKKRIITEILWNELIINKYSKKIIIDKEKIKKEILLNDKKLKSFLLSEIVFDLPSGEKIEKKFKIIEDEISKNGFENTALIYSISDTSSSGGKLGWIKEISLNKSIKEIILNLKIGEHTNPIKIPSGFLILKVKDIKETNEQLDIKKELERRIRNDKNQQLNQFSLLYYNKIKKNIKINDL